MFPLQPRPQKMFHHASPPASRSQRGNGFKVARAISAGLMATGQVGGCWEVFCSIRSWGGQRVEALSFPGKLELYLLHSSLGLLVRHTSAFGCVLKEPWNPYLLLPYQLGDLPPSKSKLLTAAQHLRMTPLMLTLPSVLLPCSLLCSFKALKSYVYIG